jgi:hypothetical protein
MKLGKFHENFMFFSGINFYEMTNWISINTDTT